MKFWQLVSIFRSNTEIIEDEFKKPEWSFYYEIYNNLEFIIKHQKRDLLDVKVDDVLLKNICDKSNLKIYGSIDNGTIYSYKNIDTNKEFTISEAINLFNHDSIEEVFEKSCSIVG